MMASTERYQRIRAYMVEAVGRTTVDRFTRWRRFTSFSKKVKATPSRATSVLMSFA